MCKHCPICGDRRQVYRVGRVVVDQREREITVDGKAVHINPTGQMIMEILASDPGRVWSQDQIIEGIDPYGRRDITSFQLHTQISRLRKLLAGAAIIRSIYGRGYAIEAVS